MGTSPSSSGPANEASARVDEPTPRWVDLDLHEGGGCAVESSGELWCWGQQPAQPWGLEGVRAVSASADQSCWIEGEGRVHCVDARGREHLVEGVDHAVELRVADSRACARRADGALLCWQADQAATQLAEGALTFSVEWTGGCMLQARGELACWKQAAQWDASIGSPTSMGLMPGAVDLDLSDYADRLWLLDDHGRVRYASWRNYDPGFEWKEFGEVPGGVEIVAARFNVCVRTSTGAVLCRGRNQYGQLGVGSSSAHEGFVTMLPAGARGIALTDLRTCARTLDEVVCAGLDVAALEPAAGTLHQHTLALEAISIAAEGSTTCALDASGSLRCWGWELLDAFEEAPEDDFGIEQAAQPTLVREDVGSLAGIASREGALDWVDAGQLRTAWWQGGPDWTLAEVHLAGPPTKPAMIRALAADLIACTIEAGSAKDVLSCGLEVGERRPIAGVEGPVAVATHFLQVCAIDRKARVVCLGHPDLYEEDAVIVPKLVPGVRKARAIAMGGAGTCALVEGGRVLCWTGKRIDWPDDSMRLEYEASPVSDMGLDDVVAIVATEDWFCSLDGAGAVRCWSPGSSRVDLPGPKLDQEVVEIVAGSEHACARDRAGAVTCWGDESRGQLGRVPLAVSLTPTPLRFDAQRSSTSPSSATK